MEARIAPRFRTVQGAGVISHSEKFWLAELILRRRTNFLKMTITAEKPRKSEALRAYVHGGGGEGALGKKTWPWVALVVYDAESVTSALEASIGGNLATIY